MSIRCSSPLTVATGTWYTTRKVCILQATPSQFRPLPSTGVSTNGGKSRIMTPNHNRVACVRPLLRRRTRALFHSLSFFDPIPIPTSLPKEHLHLALHTIHDARLRIITLIRVAARPPLPRPSNLGLLLLLQHRRCLVGILIAAFHRGGFIPGGDTRRGRRAQFKHPAALILSPQLFLKLRVRWSGDICGLLYMDKLNGRTGAHCRMDSPLSVLHEPPPGLAARQRLDPVVRSSGLY
jgi:hypothetical protein